MNTIEAKLHGRAETTPEIITSQRGTSYARITVTVSQPPDRDGNFYNIRVSVTCFGELAAKATREIVKGQQVYCEGVLTISKWTSAKGYKNSSVNLKATSVELVEKDRAEQ